MELRRSRKSNEIYEDGQLRDQNEYKNSMKNKKKYQRHLTKKTAIQVNMIRLLEVVESKKPTVHLDFWKENLQSSHPIIEIRKSNLLHGGFGVFVTDNCLYIPKGLMFLPNCIEPPQYNPASSGTKMSLYQFSVKYKGKEFYMFPTTEVDGTLPCGQFINSPLRPSQGNYIDCITPKCRQAMHEANAELLGKVPGGFKSIKEIYSGFEVLGSYGTSYHLPEVEDYQKNKDKYKLIWIKETRAAIAKETIWKKTLKNRNMKSLQQLKDYLSDNCPRKVKRADLTVVDECNSSDDERDTDYRPPPVKRRRAISKELV